MTNTEIEKQLTAYAKSRGLSVHSSLGAGTQGSVYRCQIIDDSNRLGFQTGVKIHQNFDAYNREVGVYLRLQDLEVTHVLGLRVPVLINFDDDCLAIEMTIVSPPFCLDFGGAYLDRRPDYSPEVWADWRKMKEADFEDNWPRVQSILSHFESMGIYIADLNPGNIKFQ